MTVREVATPRQPQRIVVDSLMQIEPDARILEGGGALVVAARPNAEKEAVLRAGGTEVVLLPNAQGKVDLPGLLLELGRRDINELHVEAGYKLNGSLIREGCVDELLIYVAPDLLGEGMGLFDLPAIQTLDDRRKLKFHETSQIDTDLRILARFI
jgi:diaminohydroxyphosphoribosylaminopyrimidine deaminase/5-amino-6-(5-phosphoribosylamino)uracil reductase